jgi:hypothetical protein
MNKWKLGTYIFIGLLALLIFTGHGKEAGDFVSLCLSGLKSAAEDLSEFVKSIANQKS